MASEKHRMIVIILVILTIIVSLVNLQFKPFTFKEKHVRRESRRNFLYLIQAPDCLPIHLKGNESLGNDQACDILLFSFKERCNKVSGARNIKFIHLNGTSWSVGRNYLYQYAMNQTEKYEYYIFMDEDVDLALNQNSLNTTRQEGPWRAFERFLLTYRPPIASPAYCPDQGQCNSAPIPRVFVVEPSNLLGFDAAFNAIHLHALPYLLPYYEKDDKKSFWFSQIYLQMLVKHYFNNYPLIFAEVTAKNKLHRPYPRVDQGTLKGAQCNFEVFSYLLKQRVGLPPVEWKGVQVSEMAKQTCKC